MIKKTSSIITTLVMLAFILSPFQVVGAATRGAMRATEPPPPDQPVRPGGPGVKTEPLAKLDNELRNLAAKGGDEPVVVYIHAEEGADLSKVVEVLERRPLAFGGELVVAKVLPTKITKMASSPQVKSAEAWHAIQAPVPLTPKEEVKRPTREQVKELRQSIKDGSIRSQDTLKRQVPSGSKGLNKHQSPNAPDDWAGVDVIHARDAWSKGYTGEGVNIAIIDSGVDFGHPDLQDNWAEYEDGPYAGWPIALDPRSMREYYYNGTTGIDNYYDWWDYSWYADVINVLHCTGGEEASFDFEYDPDYGAWGAWHISSDITDDSLSGEIRWGIHPDEQLIDFVGFGWVPFILLDTGEAGVYDTVIADLNHDFWFDEFDDSAVLGSSDPVLNQDLGSYLYDYTLVMTGTQYVGLGWWPEDSGTENDLNGVWGTDWDEVFVVGESGTILYYDGGSWSDMASNTTENLNGVWGSASNDVFAVGYNHERLHYDGASWSPFPVAIYTSDLYGVWGSASNNVFAVGENGVIRRYNGTFWGLPMSSGSTTFYGVWGSASNDVFAVGAGGAIRHYSGIGVTWTSQTSNTPNDLYGVWGSGSSDVFAVGASGTIQHYNGSTWSGMTSPTSEDLRSVWGNPISGEVYAVGANGTILYYDGSNWYDITSGTSENLNGVWGSGSEDVFAVGANGTILHFYNPIAYLDVPPTWFYPPLQTTEAVLLPPGTWVLAWNHNSIGYIEDPDPNNWAYDGSDGIEDVSGGMVYFIADGERPIPGMDYLYPGWGSGGLPPIPYNGQLVAFMIGSYYAGGGEHGTLCASAAAAQGNIQGYFAATGEWQQYLYEDWINFPYGDGSGPSSIMPWWNDVVTGTVKGPAPEANIIAIGDSYQVVHDMQGMYDAYTFLAFGVDGKPNSGDEFADIVSMSYGDGSVHNDGWDWESRLLSYYNQQYLLHTTLVDSAGNGGHGYGTVSTPGGSTELSVGASTLYGQDTAFGSGMEPSQLNEGEVQPFSNRGPDALGGPDPDVLATGAWGAGDVPLNLAPGYAAGYIYPGDGNNAWYSWGGTSRSSPEAAGVLALVYDAYRQSHSGNSPDFETAQQILMSSADDLSHDVLMQGAGRVNADRATDVAGSLDGIFVSPSELAAGEYHGERYEAFTNVLFPGDTWAETIIVTNTSGSMASASIGDEMLLQMDSPVEYSVVVKPEMGLEDNNYPQNYYYYADYFVIDHPSVDDEYGEELVIVPPEDADLMQVELVVPMELFDFTCGEWDEDPPYDCLWWKTYNDPNPYSLTYKQNQRWSLTVYDWTDLDENGWLWKDTNMDRVVNPMDTADQLQVSAIFPWEEWQTEINRFAYSYIYGNTQQVTVRLGDREDIDNIVIGIAHKYPNDARPGWDESMYDANPLQVKVTYYQKGDFSLVSESTSSLVVPAGGNATFDAVFTIPGDMYPGLYEGAITVDDGTHLTLIPTTVNVAVPSSELYFELGKDGDAFASPYQNYHMDGGWDWMWDYVYEQGDWRFFYYDADAGFEQQYLYVRDKWGELCGNMPTFNETLVWGPNYDDQYSLIEPEKYGPYGMQFAGGTPWADYFDPNWWSEWGRPRIGYWWNTSEGPQPESRAWATLWDGLNMVQFRNILLSGKQSCGEGYEAEAGVFGVDAPESGLVINTTTESGSFTVDAVSPVEGLGAYAGGFGEMQYFKNQTVPQGKHSDERWPDDLMSGWKYEFSAVKVNEIGAQVQGPGTSDVAVALMYDANGDGLFNMYDSKEALAYLDDYESGGEDLWYSGGEGFPFVPDGRYAVILYGNWILPSDQFNVKLTLWGGDSLSIEGSGSANNYVVDTVPGEPVELTVNYTVPGAGLWQGFLKFWMPSEEDQQYDPRTPVIFVPVTINKEGALVSVQKDVDKEVVKWGDILTYTILIQNAGATEIGTQLTDMLPEGLALLSGSISSTLEEEYPEFWEEHGCEYGYDEWMRTIHYNCSLGGAYPEDTITFQARVVAQRDTEFLNKADLKWYWGGEPGVPYSFEYDTALSYIPKTSIYLPVIKMP